MTISQMIGDCRDVIQTEICGGGEFHPQAITSDSPRQRGYELFVGNISFFCHEVDLFRLFSKFGKVLKVRIKRSGAGLNGGRTLMYGFVEMAELTDAESATQKLNSMRHMGRDIRVELTGNSNVHSSTFQPKLFEMHISFISQFQRNAVVHPHEELLRSIFESYGFVVKDLAVKQYNIIKNIDKQEGFGFVAFGSAIEAHSAVNMFNGANIQGFEFSCSLSHHNPKEILPPQPQPVLMYHNEVMRAYQVPQTTFTYLPPSLQQQPSLQQPPLYMMHITEQRQAQQNWLNGPFPSYSTPMVSVNHSMMPTAPYTHDSHMSLMQPSLLGSYSYHTTSPTVSAMPFNNEAMSVVYSTAGRPPFTQSHNVTTEQSFQQGGIRHSGTPAFDYSVVPPPPPPNYVPMVPRLPTEASYQSEVAMGDSTDSDISRRHSSPRIKPQVNWQYY